MEKDLVTCELYEEYKSLLTENQSELFHLYYFCDLSLGEISQIKNISRQGVSDSISKTRELLNLYESKLKLLYKKQNLIKLTEDISCEDGKIKLLNAIKEL